MLQVGVGSQSSLTIFLLTMIRRTLTDLAEDLFWLVFSEQPNLLWPFCLQIGQVMSLARQYFSGLGLWLLRVYQHGDPPQLLHFSDEELDGLFR